MNKEINSFEAEVQAYFSYVDDRASKVVPRLHKGCFEAYGSHFESYLNCMERLDSLVAGFHSKHLYDSKRILLNERECL